MYFPCWPVNYTLAEAGDIRRRLTIVSYLAGRPTAAIWGRVRGANYVIARGWWRTMQARMARQATIVDDG